MPRCQGEHDSASRECGVAVQERPVPRAPVNPEVGRRSSVARFNAAWDCSDAHDRAVSQRPRTRAKRTGTRMLSSRDMTRRASRAACRPPRDLSAGACRAEGQRARDGTAVIRGKKSDVSGTKAAVWVMVRASRRGGLRHRAQLPRRRARAGDIGRVSNATGTAALRQSVQ